MPELFKPHFDAMHHLEIQFYIQKYAACFWLGKEVCEAPEVTTAGIVLNADMKYVAVSKVHKDEAANPNIKSWKVGGKIIVKQPNEEPIDLARRIGHARLQAAEATGDKGNV
ncbi:MAG: hypothetical protein GOMPHAMPRED_000312 [Gomphillus americanus]|uniref:Uncharacterized protein n=1 Tax=Gomphillus americanus TaxID=1940652 RepID=A0A8H3EAX0_9LECA|nr:MAG: hypothetical protein GOMPHAMPRED_000312 [Gomphillus americanus]